MQSSAFAAGDIGVNHNVFKNNSIKIYIWGGGQIAHRFDTLQNNSSTKQIWDAMTEANQVAVVCVSLEDANWMPQDSMWKQQVKTFLELFSYLFHISEKNRRSALTLAFKHRETLFDFVSDWKSKSRNTPTISL